MHVPPPVLVCAPPCFQASSSSAQQQLLAYQEASSQEVAQLREQLQEALLDNGRLKSEQQRGAAKLSEYRGALDKWKARQAELEELVLELHESASKQAAALVAAAREREQLIAQLAVGATGAGTDASATAQGTHGLSSSSGAPASTSSGPGGARPHAINQAAGDGGGAAAAAGAAAMPSPSSSDTAAAATTTAAGGIGQSQQFTAAVEARLEAIARLHNQQAAAAAAENRALSDQLRELVGQHARLQLEADTARSATAARLVAAEALSEQRRYGLTRGAWGDALYGGTSTGKL